MYVFNLKISAKYHWWKQFKQDLWAWIRGGKWGTLKMMQVKSQILFLFKIFIHFITDLFILILSFKNITWLLGFLIASLILFSHLTLIQPWFCIPLNGVICVSFPPRSLPTPLPKRHLYLTCHQPFPSCYRVLVIVIENDCKSYWVKSCFLIRQLGARTVCLDMSFLPSGLVP